MYIDTLKERLNVLVMHSGNNIRNRTFAIDNLQYTDIKTVMLGVPPLKVPWIRPATDLNNEAHHDNLL